MDIARLLDIDAAQQVLAEHWKPYLENLHDVMTDATCYETFMHFPTDIKFMRWRAYQIHN